MTAKDYVELTAAAMMPLSVVCVFAHLLRSKKSLGVRLIQTIAVSSFMPGVIILAFERIIDGAAVAALVGGLAGYLFST